MAKLGRRKISKRTVDRLTVKKDTVFWDSELQGFGIRVYPSGTKVYIVQTRARGQKAQRVKVADYGVIPPSEARRRAVAILLRIKSGREPHPPRPAEKQVAESVAHPSPDRAKRKPRARWTSPSREAVRAGAIRISDSIAHDVITGWEERER